MKGNEVALYLATWIALWAVGWMALLWRGLVGLGFVLILTGIAPAMFLMYELAQAASKEAQL